MQGEKGETQQPKREGQAAAATSDLNVAAPTTTPTASEHRPPATPRIKARNLPAEQPGARP
jgi:hypothetical protein